MLRMTGKGIEGQENAQNDRERHRRTFFCHSERSEAE